MKRRVLQRSLGLMLLVVLASLLPGLASAHAQLLRSSPSYGETLTTPPTEALLWFSEPIDPAFSQATLRTPDGRTVNLPGAAHVGTSDPNQLVVPLGALEITTYTLVWQVVSATDGHRTTGTLVFTIAVPGSVTPNPTTTSVPPATTTSGEMAGPSAWAILVRWLQFAGLMLIGGGAIFGLLVLAPALGRDEAEAAIIGWRRLMQLGMVVLGLGIGGALLVQAGIVSEQPLGWAVLGPLLASRWGTIWSARLGCWLALWPLVLPASWRLRRAPLALAVLTTLPLIATFSLLSHAAASATGLAAAITTDAVHLAMAAVWAGGLAALAGVLWPLRSLNVEPRARLTAAVVGRFSRLAIVSVAVLLISGTYAALQHLTSFADLTGSGYGRALLIKLILVALAWLLGGYHWLMAQPQLLAGKQPAVLNQLVPRMSRTVRLESGLAVGVLLAASWLVQLPPPPTSAGTIPATPTTTTVPSVVASAMAPQPFATEVVTGGLKIDLAVDNQAIGERTFTVKLDQPADRVRLRITMLDMDMGTTNLDLVQQPDGSYSGKSPAISMAGNWRLELTVRRKGQEDVVVPIPFDAQQQ